MEPHLTYVADTPEAERRRAVQLGATRTLERLLHEQIPPVRRWEIGQLTVLRGHFAAQDAHSVVTAVRALYRTYGGIVRVRNRDGSRDLSIRFSYRNWTVELGSSLPPAPQDGPRAPGSARS